MANSPGPDFLVIGAPAAGAETLFAALALHPQTCTDAGPEPGQLRGDLAPYVLSDREAHRRIAEAVPSPKLIAVVRNPIDRAHLHWQRLRDEGREPEQDFARAVQLSPERLAGDWGPEFDYAGLGRYGEQFAHLYEHVAPRRTMILRYRDLLEAPRITSDRACEFLGIDTGLADVPGGQAELANPSTDQRAALLSTFSDDIDRLRKVTGQDFSDWLDPAPVPS